MFQVFLGCAGCGFQEGLGLRGLGCRGLSIGVLGGGAES